MVKSSHNHAVEEMGGILLKAHESSFGHYIKPRGSQKNLADYDSSAVEGLPWEVYSGDSSFPHVQHNCGPWSRVFVRIKGLDLPADREARW